MLYLFEIWLTFNLCPLDLTLNWCMPRLFGRSLISFLLYPFSLSLSLCISCHIYLFTHSILSIYFHLNFISLLTWASSLPDSWLQRGHLVNLFPLVGPCSVTAKMTICTNHGRGSDFEKLGWTNGSATFVSEKAGPRPIRRGLSVGLQKLNQYPIKSRVVSVSGAGRERGDGHQVRDKGGGGGSKFDAMLACHIQSHSS